MKKLLIATVAAFGLTSGAAFAQPTSILNVSYDIARELYAAVNEAFIPYYAEKTGNTLAIEQSHAGSSAQARAILEGLEADLVTFNQVTDVQLLANNGYIASDWQTRLANNASPYYSLPAFLVRAGNPKEIKDWDDLVRDGVELVFPNPKTSGNARYTYLAARAFAEEKFNNDDAQVAQFMQKLFSNVPGFPAGGRAATTAFIEQGIGDVLITFEAEVYNIRDQYGAATVEPVVPSVSIKAEFPVAVVDKVADARGSREIAEEYLNFLYSKTGQQIVADFYNRVDDAEVLAANADKFPQIRLLTVEETFGGWDQLAKDHFAEGALLDQAFANQ